MLILHRITLHRRIKVRNDSIKAMQNATVLYWEVIIEHFDRPTVLYEVQYMAIIIWFDLYSMYNRSAVRSFTSLWHIHYRAWLIVKLMPHVQCEDVWEGIQLYLKARFRAFQKAVFCMESCILAHELQ